MSIMKAEISLPVPIFVESSERYYLLGISLEGVEISASMTLDEEKKGGRVELYSPCPSPLPEVYIPFINKTVIAKRVNIDTYCKVEEALLRVLEKIQDAEDLIKLDDYVDVLDVDQQKVLKASALGGAALFYVSHRFGSVLPLMYYPPPPRVQIALIESAPKGDRPDSVKDKVSVKTLIDILGILVSQWKEDVSIIDELLSNISYDLYGEYNYVGNPPLIPLAQEGFYISLIPRAQLGCPTKLVRYREELLRKIERMGANYMVLNISHGLKIGVKGGK